MEVLSLQPNSNASKFVLPLCAVLMGIPVTAMGVSSSSTTFDVPAASVTSPTGINNRGTVVGLFTDSEGTHGFIRIKRQFKNLDVPGTDSTEAEGINNRGQIVGQFNDASGQHGFLFSKEEFTIIDLPGASLTGALDINDGGDIVGQLRDPSGNDGFLISEGRVIGLSV